MTGAETGSLILLDANSDPYFEVALGQVSGDLNKKRIPKGLVIGGWVAGNNTATIIPDVQTDERFFRATDDSSQFVTRSMSRDMSLACCSPSTRPPATSITPT